MMLQEGLNGLFVLTDDGTSSVMEMSVVAQNLVQHLKENSQLQLAQRYTSDGVSTALEHLNTQNVRLDAESQVGKDN